MRGIIGIWVLSSVSPQAENSRIPRFSNGSLSELQTKRFLTQFFSVLRGGWCCGCFFVASR